MGKSSRISSRSTSSNPKFMASPSDFAVSQAAEFLVHLLDLDAREHGFEKRLDQDSARLFRRQAAAAQIEDLVLVGTADGRAVRATELVGLDFQNRPRVAA